MMQANLVQRAHSNMVLLRGASVAVCHQISALAIARRKQAVTVCLRS
jgi:hypothetical protein